jgi:hypothetical protein
VLPRGKAKLVRCEQEMQREFFGMAELSNVLTEILIEERRKYNTTRAFFVVRECLSIMPCRGQPYSIYYRPRALARKRPPRDIKRVKVCLKI